MARRKFQDPTVRRAGRGKREYWYIRYRVDVLGSEKRAEVYRPLGLCKDVSRRDAERLKADIMRSVNRADYVIQSQMPFPDLVDVWERLHLPTVRDCTAAAYRSHLRAHIMPWFEDKRLCDVDRREVEEWMLSLQHLSQGTRRINLVLVRHLFDRAADWGYWEKTNPARGVKLGSYQGGWEKEPLTVRQFQLLLTVIDEEPLRTIVELAVWTGMRISEILGLSWGRIVDGAVFVRGETKTAASRRGLPLGHLAGQLVRPAGATNGALVFPNTPPYQTLQRHLRAALRKIGIDYPGCGFHVLRHTHATWFQDRIAGETQAQMGHATARMTAHYVHRDWQSREAAVRQMQEAALGETGEVH